jgi:hypothetical protein
MSSPAESLENMANPKTMQATITSGFHLEDLRSKRGQSGRFNHGRSDREVLPSLGMANGSIGSSLCEAPADGVNPRCR